MIQKYLIILLLVVSNTVWANYSLKDVLKLKNDKEVIITNISKKEIARISSQYNDPKFVEQLTNIFYSSVLSFMDDESAQCDPLLLTIFQSKLLDYKFENKHDDLVEYFKILRVNHAIDNVLYEALNDVTKDHFAMKELNSRKAKLILFPKKKILPHNNLSELFAEFEPWPNDIDQCAYNQYVFLKKNIKSDEEIYSDKEKYLKYLTKKALKEEIISQDSYNKLEYLRTKSKVNDRNFWLADYFKVVFHAKNKMVPKNYVYQVKELSEENGFSSERIRRFSKMTRRQLLYNKYNETQIILLAQVLQKASQRMGVDPDTITEAPYISQTFHILNDSGERETYVERIDIDPPSQFRLARRLLRKDITELQMMDVFYKLTITHEDVVMAALETGYISLEDIEHVVKYDDLWNPNKTKFERVMGFVFTIARYSTFYIPAPWNLVTSIALGVVEGVVDNRNKNGADNDNPSTFIE
jgi:hypothetical protein